MTLRKLSAFSLAVIFVMMSAGNSFALVGEGYFGPDNPPPNSVIIDPPYYDSPYTVSRNDNYRRQEERRREDDYRREEELRRQAEIRRQYEIRREEERRREDERRRDDERYRRRYAPNYEKYSTNSEKVIPSYGFDSVTTQNLLDLHYSASRGNGKGERYDRYTMILRDFPEDYLAAYEASRNAYEMADYGMAMHWVNKALEILPQYVPARQFKRTVEGALRRR